MYVGGGQDGMRCRALDKEKLTRIAPSILPYIHFYTQELTERLHTSQEDIARKEMRWQLERTELFAQLARRDAEVSDALLCNRRRLPQSITGEMHSLYSSQTRKAVMRQRARILDFLK